MNRGFLIMVCLLASTKSYAQPSGPAQVHPPEFGTENLEIPTNPKGVTPGQEEPVPQIQRQRDFSDSQYQPESHYIEHPNAAKGLIKIDKDKVYLYKVPTSEQTSAAAIRIGYYNPTELVNPDDSSLAFEDLYEDNYPIFLYDRDWEISQKFGVLSWKWGAGLYFAQGHGKFADSGGVNAGLVPKEKFTLLVIPLNAGLSYRLKYFKNQWLVPYVEGAADAFCFGEYRDDNNNPGIGMKLGIAPAAHASAGLSVALGKDARSFLDLDREYGINAVYITAEYRQIFSLSDKFDFSGSIITGGITAEY